MDVYAAAARQKSAVTLGMDNCMLMDEGIKVTLAYKAGQQHVAEVWRFFGQTLESYTLACVKKEILEYFTDTAAKNLGIN